MLFPLPCWQSTFDPVWARRYGEREDFSPGDVGGDGDPLGGPEAGSAAAGEAAGRGGNSSAAALLGRRGADASNDERAGEGLHLRMLVVGDLARGGSSCSLQLLPPPPQTHTVRVSLLARATPRPRSGRSKAVHCLAV